MQSQPADGELHSRYGFTTTDDIRLGKSIHEAVKSHKCEWFVEERCGLILAAQFPYYPVSSIYSLNTALLHFSDMPHSNSALPSIVSNTA